jgi:HAD superfamily hydrolase (TIGR01509 family)
MSSANPEPRIYDLVRARLDVQPQEMIFLDGLDRAVAGAREAGIHTVRYRDNAQAIREIEQLLTAP